MRGMVFALLLLLISTPVRADGTLTLVTTTSTEHSGLMDVLLPAYREKTGVTVRAIVASTGKALRIAKAGDADILIAHDRWAELALVKQGHTSFRRPLMYNDFVIVGPESDPAKIATSPTVDDALHRIAVTRALFASRGDDSGTHRREVNLWGMANIKPGAWLLETGSGQGPTLNFAAARGAYALTDRGTWLFFGNKAGLTLLYEGDEKLRNEYGISMVNPSHHPHVDGHKARAFIDWLTGSEGQALITRHRIGGQQAFFASAPLHKD